MPHQHLPHDHGKHSDRLQLGIPGEQPYETVSDLLKLLSDSKRLHIFWLLCHCEECVVNLSVLTDISSPAVSHHLKQLKNAGLVISRRNGREVCYTAAKTARTQVLHDMIERIMEVGCPVQDQFTEQDSYDSQTQTVSQIHTLLISDLQRRYTIEELSEMFHINQTTLKATFKKMYAKPIAAYMKEYRMKRACELLKHTDRSISDISRETGYENQSKFTQAFKDVTGLLPKEYRKNCRAEK